MDFSKLANMRKERGLLAVAVRSNVAEILIYDIIGEDFLGEGVTAKGIVQELAALPQSVDTILLRINSPGGDVFDGIAIMNALLQQNRTVKVQVDGLCASIASVIAMAGSTITMAATAQLMIHNPWTLSMGDASDLRKTADLLDKVRDASMLPAYARSGKTPAAIKAIMDAETWYSADEAKQAGWADQVLDMPARTAAAHTKYDLSAYKHAPAAISQPHSTPAAAKEWADQRARQRSEHIRLLLLVEEIEGDISKARQNSPAGRSEQLQAAQAESLSFRRRQP